MSANVANALFMGSLALAAALIAAIGAVVLDRVMTVRKERREMEGLRDIVFPQQRDGSHDADGAN